MIPHSDWDACVTPDEWGNVCILATNYWPFDENGEAVPWNINADSNPSLTADGYTIDADTEYAEVIAVPLPILRWSNRNWGRKITMWNTRFAMHDTFGNSARQDGIIWHEHFRMKLLPVDILTDIPIHQVTCDWKFE